MAEYIIKGDPGAKGHDGRAIAADVADVADVVEVVRCKDCLFREEPKVYGRSIIGELWCRLIGVPMNLNDFCSYGERKEKNDK